MFAVLAVVSIHADRPAPFQGLDTNFNIVLCLIDQVRLFAVPFFFIVSGYFFSKALQTGASAPLLLLRYAKRLIPIFIAWCVIYAFTPSNWREAVSQFGALRAIYWQFLHTSHWISLHPLAIFWFGTEFVTGFLWFFPALLVGLAAITIFRSLKLERFAIPLASALYVFGLIERSRVMSLQYPDVSYDFRAKLFMALLFTLLGRWLSVNMKRPYLSLGVILVLVGYALEVIEATTIWHYYIETGPPRPGTIQYLLGTVPLSVGIFLIAVAKPEAGKRTILPFLAKFTLGVYGCHMFIIKLLDPVRDWLPNPMWNLAWPVVVYLLAVMVAVILSRFTLTNTYLVQARGAVPILRK